MAILHAMFCIGMVIVILLSTAYFAIFGIENWRYLPLLFATLPLACLLLFSVAPVPTLVAKEEKLSYGALFSNRFFLISLLLMLAAGSAEMAMSQWVSVFVESSLQLSKTVGDLLGTCLFAAAMTLMRFLYAGLCRRIPIERLLTVSGGLSAIGYLISALVPVAPIALFGCFLCGIACAPLWPGTYSLSQRYCPKGGNRMFSYLALAGDIGCLAGPTLLGVIADAFGGDFRRGLLFAPIFGICVIVGIFLLKTQRNKHSPIE